MNLAGSRGLSEPNAATRFTVLLPVQRPPAMLPCAIETVLAQSVKEFELLIIGDGAPDETIACARTYAERDPRVKVLPFAKGLGCGEAHRHVALADAMGRNVAHIADDDLWFPNHLEEMEKLLQTVDFGHLAHVNVNGRGFEILFGDLASSRLRERMLAETYNILGDTVAGYRLDAYRLLPEGWAPAPVRDYPDLKMWRKFLRQNDLAFGTRAVVTALIFPTEVRRNLSLEDRARELRQWQRRIADPAQRQEIVQEAWHSLMRDCMQMDDDRRARLKVIEAMDAQFKALARTNYHPLRPNSQIDFSERGNSFLYTASGWSFPEEGFRWTDGEAASIHCQLGPLSNGDSAVIRLRASAFGDRQRVAVVVDGKQATELTLDAMIRDYDIPVQLPHLTGASNSEIRFQLPDAHSPASRGLSPDERKLGIAVTSIAFLSSPAGREMGGT